MFLEKKVLRPRKLQVWYYTPTQLPPHTTAAFLTAVTNLNCIHLNGFTRLADSPVDTKPKPNSKMAYYFNRIQVKFPLPVSYWSAQN